MQPNDTTTPRICWDAPNSPVRGELRRHLPIMGAIGGVGVIACGLVAVCVLSFQNHHPSPAEVATSDVGGYSLITVAGARPVVRQTHVQTTDGHGVETRTPLVVGAAFAAPESKPALTRPTTVVAEPARTVQPSISVAPTAAAFAEEARGGGERRWSILHDTNRSQFQSMKAQSTDALHDDAELLDDIPVAAVPEAIPAPTSKASRAEGKSDARRTTKVVRSVNLRSKPGGKGLGTIKRGTVVSVGHCDEWCEVVTGGRKGFVYRRFLGRIS